MGRTATLRGFRYVEISGVQVLCLGNKMIGVH